MWGGGGGRQGKERWGSAQVCVCPGSHLRRLAPRCLARRAFASIPQHTHGPGVSPGSGNRNGRDFHKRSKREQAREQEGGEGGGEREREREREREKEKERESAGVS